MNTIDLIVCLILALAVWNGWRQGFVMQICSLAGIVAGIWLASRYGVLVAVAGRLVRKLFHFAGFGIPDIVLGIAVSVLKYMLVLSVLFSAFDSLNEDYTLVGPQTIEKSKSYKPVMRLSEAVFPFLEWVGEQVPQEQNED